MESQSDILQKAIDELKSSPTVDIKGKSYTQVSTRINIFRKYFPNASIETNIVHNDEIKVIIQTKISLNSKVVATGYAEELRGDGNYINQTSAVENCETSSIGRALSNLGLGGSEYASSFEVENAISQQQNIKQSVNNNHLIQSNQKTYQHQQDFSLLINAGLQVVEQGNLLIVIGEGVFDKRSIIKNAGFRWDGQGKQWYMKKRQAA